MISMTTWGPGNGAQHFQRIQRQIQSYLLFPMDPLNFFIPDCTMSQLSLCDKNLPRLVAPLPQLGVLFFLFSLSLSFHLSVNLVAAYVTKLTRHGG